MGKILGVDELLDVESRGVIYIGEERYMAGVLGHQTIFSMIPGLSGEVKSFSRLVSRWRKFRDDPRYQSAVESIHYGGSPLADAQRFASQVNSYVDTMKLRDILGRNQKQSDRTRRMNAARREAKKAALEMEAPF